ncbi:putative H/ACA ribonucleoprotein complex subunit GAR1 [Blattamonas nauphoetae]|uniref:H/ACA ribonucleoprotein complex subunit n=1 Tax=Blattamonas nauphoetae TaxID=2049346 RepID=A0ABQ9XXJ5_9EUKA|nr:putative H/ACA ribonucleoprotein complex subunit GAR1 [Blattamonas nauphoetae]
MSYQGSGYRGNSRGGFQGGRGGQRFSNYGGRGYNQDQGPPAELVEMGEFMHPCEEDLVCKVTNDRVPYNNAFIYNEQKAQIGKVDEVLGSFTQIYFSVKPDGAIKSQSFKAGDKFYMSSDKMKDKEAFLAKPGFDLAVVEAEEEEVHQGEDPAVAEASVVDEEEGEGVALEVEEDVVASEVAGVEEEGEEADLEVEDEEDID